ncbi:MULTISPECIES: hypothetical protein [Chryseobacterium]|uniref:Lipoprotein n=1 Tax=Chryseobacterium camelliae TaxID=1265445 RepID=A0ABU0TD92_9FLAO|nr:MULTISPECIES: hypothetical protein [Chryseobacterium]MDT3407166.1 hypothetical protein [Pseudacidovorax intermedius]MDQ1095044.1 hypothetical protein [Chryseobacterium camelliae]MDQ1098983.1 hypothetical protein [Chryseobacterium sp. SORGH_AS_1048]MDR6086331.1 hypothetical protein [Chryseobacterium sp. SORGH_AS_0909]MDR6130703.1 hypothetical protein [Chryseobacterium sp. SORGH_AS_1175]
MKASTILSLGIFSTVLFSCATVHDKLNTGMIVRDCTGTYLRVGEHQDYLVCNSEVLESKKDGEKVSVVFDNTDKCPERDGKIMCMMYHENKGMIRVKSVK